MDSRIQQSRNMAFMKKAKSQNSSDLSLFRDQDGACIIIKYFKYMFLIGSTTNNPRHLKSWVQQSAQLLRVLA